MTNNKKQREIKKEFIPYELALDLQELGFDEYCFGVYFNVTQELFIGKTINKHTRDVRTLAPTYSQAFTWFREMDLYSEITFDHTKHDESIGFYWRIWWSPTEYSSDAFGEECGYETFQEAQVACLKELIEIVTNCHEANIFIHLTHLSLLERIVKGNKKLFREESTPEQHEEFRKEMKNLEDRINNDKQ